MGIFENRPENFQHFTGLKVPSSQLAELDCAGKDIAIIGTDQFTVSHLNHISQHARSVKVFQINPQFVLPGTEHGLQRLLNHPLIIKNRRLFNSRIKSILSLRYLENQVQNLLDNSVQSSGAEQFAESLADDVLVALKLKAKSASEGSNFVPTYEMTPGSSEQPIKW